MVLFIIIFGTLSFPVGTREDVRIISVSLCISVAMFS